MNPDLKQQIQQGRVKRALTIGVCLGAAVLAFIGIGGLNWQTYQGSFDQLTRLISEFFPLSFERAHHWWQPALETILMAVAGTCIGAVIALPLSCLAARSTSPHPIVAQLIRFVLHILRSIPDLLWAVLLCVGFGAGPFAGMLALCLHSIGALGKQFSEHIEHASPEPIMAIRSTGAGNIALISHGILAQVQGLFYDVILYRFEINIRTATILGFVGAGGLGQEILSAMRTLAYQEVAAQLCILILIIAAIDALSAFIRRRALPKIH